MDEEEAIKGAESPIQYLWTYLRRFGRECYRTWRQELMASVLVCIAAYVIAYVQGDPHAWADLRIALLASGIVLAFFVIWHLIRTPWLLHQDVSVGATPVGKRYGVLGAVIVLCLLASFAGASFFAVNKIVERNSGHQSASNGNSSEQSLNQDSSFHQQATGTHPSVYPEYAELYGKYQSELGTPIALEQATKLEIFWAQRGDAIYIQALGAHLVLVNNQWQEVPTDALMGKSFYDEKELRKEQHIPQEFHPYPGGRADRPEIQKEIGYIRDFCSTSLTVGRFQEFERGLMVGPLPQYRDDPQKPETRNPHGLIYVLIGSDKRQISGDYHQKWNQSAPPCLIPIPQIKQQ
jgi:hypothetical protein